MLRRQRKNSSSSAQRVSAGDFSRQGRSIMAIAGHRSLRRGADDDDYSESVIAAIINNSNKCRRQLPQPGRGTHV